MRQVNSVIRCYVARIILFVIVSTLLNHHEFLCMLPLSKLHGILSSNRSMLLLLIAKAAVIVTKLLSLKKSQRKTSPFRVCCLHMNNDNPNCMRCEDWEMRLFVTKLLLLAPFHGPLLLCKRTFHLSNSCDWPLYENFTPNGKKIVQCEFEILENLFSKCCFLTR